MPFFGTGLGPPQARGPGLAHTGPFRGGRVRGGGGVRTPTLSPRMVARRRNRGREGRHWGVQQGDRERQKMPVLTGGAGPSRRGGEMLWIRGADRLVLPPLAGNEPPTGNETASHHRLGAWSPHGQSHPLSRMRQGLPRV